LDIETISIGVAGCGYWGPNHIRNFLALRGMGAQVVVAADRDTGRRKHVSELYPAVRLTEEADAIIEDPSVDAVVIATPVANHYGLAKAALLRGKHVLVEKPFVTDIGQAQELVALAERQQRVLMVGHTFEYAAAVNRIRHLIEDGELGDILYVRSLRVNLGILQPDVSVLWDLAPHDVSILLYILQQRPTAVSAVGSAHYSKGLDDVISVNLEFPSQLMANIVCSWLDPRKVREMTIVGTKKMLVYDDVSANEKVRIYDRGVDEPRHYDSFGEFQYTYRYGDIVTPYLEEYEPLRAECAHFLECIKTGKSPRTSGLTGLAVVRILAAAEQSLRLGGTRVPIGAIGASAPSGPPAATADRVQALVPTGSKGSPEIVNGRCRVLVVGTDQHLLGFITRALDAFQPGSEVITARTPEAASQWMETFLPDVIILDGDLAQTTETGRARWLESMSTTPVLLLGGEAPSQLPEATVLSKPLRLPSLLSAMRAVER
jgi:predicted dehydrogenase/CheY-like chemotaxis protein